LYFTSPSTDYLADSILHGLRNLLGSDVVDYPKCEVLYKGCDLSASAHLHGKGFSLYTSLDDIAIDRLDIFHKLKAGYFDLVVFSSIQRQYGLYVQCLPWLQPGQTLILDGEDGAAMYPYQGGYWRHPYYWFLPRAHNRFLYFKREWTPDTIRHRWYLLPPRWLAARLPAPRNLRRISFSIPADKIVSEPPLKSKLFPRHIVDPEVAENVPGSATGHVFDNEQDYYADLRAARFGITTKRAGWEAIRHYELAASGCVLCFRDLDKKPATCAPDGLDETNTIIYHSWSDLMAKIERLSDSEYARLQAGALAWVRAKTTTELAKKIIIVCKP
jgi:hypothetical protein